MRMQYGVWTCVLFTVGLAVVPRASAQIDQRQYFGSEVSMDALANITVGSGTGLNAQALSFRFTALQSGYIKTVQGYLVTDPSAGGKNCAYACDTGGQGGGTLVVTLMQDDGTSAHHPLQSGALGSVSLPQPVNANDFYAFTFSSPVQVTANTMYHLVWTNPTGTSTDFVSVETLYTGNKQASAIATNDLSALELPPGASWSTGWIELTPLTAKNESYMPIINFVYSTPANYTQGEGYVDDGTRFDIGTTSGGNAIREVFTTPSNNVTVNGVNVRLALTGGSAELHAHLEDASGNDVADCYIPSSTFGSEAVYAGCSFGTSHTLLANTTYHIDFETDAQTTYVAIPIENGFKSNIGYNEVFYGPGTVFPYGHAETEVSGGWTVFNPGACPSGCWDWQFYFN
jgi:hypothetical protein